PPGALVELGVLSRFIAETANLAFDEHAPYAGRSAFAHKGGVHVAAIRRAPRSYEHIDPALVGNRTRFVVSELSGRGNLRAIAEAHGVAAPAGGAPATDAPDAPGAPGASDATDAADAAVLASVKDHEARGFAFESAEASVAMMLRRADPAYLAPFELVDFKVLVGTQPAGAAFADAAVKLRVRGELVHTAAEGNGPVSALDAALRKALASAYPAVARIHLEDYKVRIIDGREGTAAITRVLVDHGDGRDRWSTVGASPNIIEASLRALV